MKALTYIFLLKFPSKQSEDTKTNDNEWRRTGFVSGLVDINNPKDESGVTSELAEETKVGGWYLVRIHVKRKREGNMESRVKSEGMQGRSVFMFWYIYPFWCFNWTKIKLWSF